MWAPNPFCKVVQPLEGYNLSVSDVHIWPKFALN
jgi:hypothetical protein